MLNFLEPLITRGVEDFVPKLNIDKTQEEIVRGRALALSHKLVERASNLIPHAPATVAAELLAVACVAEKIPLSRFDIARLTRVDYPALLVTASRIQKWIPSE